tara:strand:+ start:1325 stop:1825 length:501 start_codon:yes stop_codon:yes gene_type:complete
MRKPRFTGLPHDYNRDGDCKSWWRNNYIPFAGYLLLKNNGIQRKTYDDIFARYVRLKRIVLPSEAEKFTAIFRERHPEISDNRSNANWNHFGSIYIKELNGLFQLYGGILDADLRHKKNYEKRVVKDLINATKDYSSKIRRLEKLGMNSPYEDIIDLRHEQYHFFN